MLTALVLLALNLYSLITIPVPTPAPSKPAESVEYLEVPNHGVILDPIVKRSPQSTVSGNNAEQQYPYWYMDPYYVEPPPEPTTTIDVIVYYDHEKDNFIEFQYEEYNNIRILFDNPDKLDMVKSAVDLSKLVPKQIIAYTGQVTALSELRDTEVTIDPKVMGFYDNKTDTVYVTSALEPQLYNEVYVHETGHKLNHLAFSITAADVKFIVDFSNSSTIKGNGNHYSNPIEAVAQGWMLVNLYPETQEDLKHVYADYL